MSGTEIFSYVMSLTVILSNLLMIPAFFYLKSLKRSTLIFLVNLTLSIILNGVGQLLVAIFTSLSLTSFNSCVVRTLLSVASAMSYAFHMLYINLDLYLTIQRLNTTSKNVLSAKLAVAMAITAWLLGLLISFCSILTRAGNGSKPIAPAECTMFHGSFVLPYYRVIISCVFLSLLMVTVGILTATINSIRKQYTQILANQLASQAVVTGSSEPVPDNLQRHRAANATALQRKIRWIQKKVSAIKLLICVLVVFVVGWYPGITAILVASVCDTCSISEGARLAFTALVMLQNISNPLVYLTKSKEVRLAVRDVFSRCRVANRQVQPGLAVGPSATETEGL